MSEDQIRSELSEIRALQRESHAEITELINRNNDTAKWIFGGFAVACLTFAGWIALNHMELKQEHKTLQSDFGTVIKITQPLHQNCIGYEELVNKYYPSRGGMKP